MDQDPNCEIENKKISEEDKNVSKSKTVKDVFRRMFPKLNLDSIKDEDLEFGESNEADGGAEAAQVAAEEAKQAAIKAVEAAKEAVAAAQNIEGGKKEEQNLEQDQNDDPLAALSAKVDEISAKLDTLIEALSDEENQEEENQKEENQDEDLNEEENLNQDGEENENVLNAKVGDALWQDTISRAETIVPGIVAAKPKASDMKKAIIAVKRKALSDGMTKDHQAIIKPLLGGKKISALSLDALDTAFIAASEMIGKVNNSRVQKKTFQMKDLSSHSELSAINARNREFWKNKK